MNKINLLILLGSIVTAGFSASAQETKSNPMEFNGYFDLYYQNSPQAHNAVGANPPRTVEGRAFDRLNDQFVVNMVELSAKKKAGKATFRVDAAFGEMVDVLSNNGPQAGVMGTAANPASEDPTRNITQATVAYAPTESLTITAGKFYTHMGYEVTKAKDNLQYSRSYSFNYAIPLTHQGIGLTYAVMPSKLNISGYLLNGWDHRASQRTNKAPTVGAALNYTPMDGLAANYTFISAPEAGVGNGTREAHDVNLSYTVMPMLTIAADYVMGTQKKVAGGADAKWTGTVLYIKAPLTSWYTLSPRYEIYDDADNFTTGTKQKITSLTVANNFDLGDGLEARLEYRTDKSDVSTYFKDKDGAATDKQDSYTFALLYNF